MAEGEKRNDNSVADEILDTLIKEAATRSDNDEVQRLLQLNLQNLTPEQDEMLNRRILRGRRSQVPRRKLRRKVALAVVLTATVVAVGTFGAYGFDTIFSPLMGFVQNFAMRFSGQQESIIYTASGQDANICYTTLNNQIGGLIVPTWMPKETILDTYTYQELEQRARLIFKFNTNDGTPDKLRIEQQANALFDADAFRMELKNNNFDTTGYSVTILGQEALGYRMTLESGVLCTATLFQTADFTYTIMIYGIDPPSESTMLAGLKMFE